MWLLLLIGVLGLLWALSRAQRGPPGPWGVPLLGYLPFIDPVKPYESLTRLSRKYGGIYSLTLGRVKTVVLSDPRLIRHALARDECTGRAPLYLTHGIMHGYGLICAEGIRWREHRRFTISVLKNMGMVKIGGNREQLGERIFESARDLVQGLNEDILKHGDEPFDSLPLIQHCVGSLVYSMVFGVKYEQEDPLWKWLQHLQEEGTKLIGVAGPLNFLPWLRFIPKLRNSMKFLIEGKEKTHDYYRAILRDHVEAGLDEQQDQHVAGAYQKEILSRLTTVGDVGTFTEPQMLHALADLFGAGYDTTMATLRWVLLYLAINPEAQKRVQTELNDVVNSKDAAESSLMGVSDLSSCPFTEAVISEVQRLRSTVPTGIPHGAIQEIEIGGYKIAPGTMIMPLQWAVHTDPKLWGNDVMEFRPERFLNCEGRISKPDCFIPFQTGKRVCLGEELARMMLFAYTATLFFNFSVGVASDEDVESLLEGDCGITLNPKAHRLIFKPHLI